MQALLAERGRATQIVAVVRVAAVDDGVVGLQERREEPRGGLTVAAGTMMQMQRSRRPARRRTPPASPSRCCLPTSPETAVRERTKQQWSPCASGTTPCWRPCAPVRSCPPAWRCSLPGRVRRDASTGRTPARGFVWRQLGYRRGARVACMVPLHWNRPLEALICVEVDLVPLLVVVLAWAAASCGRVALGRRRLQAAPAHRCFAVQRVRRDPEHLLGDPSTSRGGGLLRLGTLARRGPTVIRWAPGPSCPPGRPSPCSARKHGDYTGTADATYNFQVTEAAGSSSRTPAPSRRTRSVRRALPAPRGRA